eukprot:PLAT14767.1.p1 GENE.PLAT14767.1~~PLAT14767.1.p1  ORF type:complete len:701 (-),score=326.92 PLAT14767.1:1516-3348(-)
MGDVDFLSSLFHRARVEATEAFERRVPALMDALESVPDMEAELHLELTSWVPGFSRFLPSDTLRISKRGSAVRMDCTLADFESGRWQRGDLSFLFTGRHADGYDSDEDDSPLESRREGSLLMLDNEKGTFFDVLAPLRTPSPEELQRTVRTISKGRLTRKDLWSRDVKFTPVHKWLASKQTREDICGHSALVYAMKDLKLVLDVRPSVRDFMSSRSGSAAPAERTRRSAAGKYVEDDDDDAAAAAAAAAKSSSKFDDDNDEDDPADDADAAALAGFDGRRAATSDADRLLPSAGGGGGGKAGEDDEEADGRAVMGTLLSAASDDDPDFQEVTVAAGDSWQESMDLTAGSSVGWQFETRKKDISFLAQFFPADGGAAESVASGERLPAFSEMQLGSFTAEVDGTLILQWDNQYSMMTAKHLRFKLVTFSGDTTRIVAEDSGKHEEHEDKELSPHELDAIIAVDAEGQRVPGHSVREETWTFEDYFGESAEAAGVRAEEEAVFPPLPRAKRTTKNFKAKLYMVEDGFPLSVEQILPLVEVMARSARHYENFQRFFKLALPPGFPVKCELPVLPTVTGRLSWENIELMTPAADKFTVPSSFVYREPEDSKTKK